MSKKSKRPHHSKWTSNSQMFKYGKYTRGFEEKRDEEQAHHILCPHCGYGQGRHSKHCEIQPG